MASQSYTSQSDSLFPLPTILRHGLIAVAFFGILSLVATFSLFIYLTYRLCSWYLKGQLRDGANQFFLLIYNLVLADLQQAVAFALTARYLATDKIEVGTKTCWANGWFISTGDLASGVFILAIAIHTFFAVVKGRRVSNKKFAAGIVSAWIFVYAMAIIGVGIDPHLYVRAGAWCWINHKHESLRLWLHYFWIFVCMFGTVVIYASIFLSIHTHVRRESVAAPAGQGSNQVPLTRAARYMIIYPVVYVICTLPLAGGRMASMTGSSVPYWWYCLAGAAITSCGWLDVLLYACTRRVLIFSPHAPAPHDMGLDTFGWNYSREGFWGTTTTISGPISDGQSAKHDRRDFFSRTTTRSLRGRDSEEHHLADQPQGVITAKTEIEVHSGDIPEGAPRPRYARSDISGYDSEGKGHELVFMNEGGLEL
ncbi:hypothetical protein HRR83_006620 [Exophiala dermatitidis]|uniref:G protein-coupled receptor 157 n=2 Tax=Exophiala dermatitidis TaxID=5970 RepID=H6BW29_EXODN|nr:G protein-coupled receptor 157 [Exophiala dermatitidis NIH/UT8656]KAJ4511371.1 hypothetical protein HRR75_005297 [Exophiala dermatitidis]EHY56000.1 G protein-coupled receptor 157 [Exophiala dermatitidis NIH/UT8656]KAJ4514121.1 hypothetical protein HRR74_005780 [Exophiala dermatitidis]KAJ4515395.1 hypothetical protein HRR73_005226 [Exophiala dermatitidis]KAJ4533770.1 hypothetical protein HRR77_008255 [Exophiala dermatitidis]